MINPMQMVGNMMGGQGGNPLVMALQTMMGNKNPMQMVQQMAGQNPQMQQMLDSLQGKNISELQQMAQNLANERGVNLQDVLNQFGITPPGGMK